MKNITNKRFPYKAFIGLTYNCNCLCNHCYARERYDDSRKKLSLNNYFDLIDQLYHLNTFSITYSHGETLLSSIKEKVFSYCSGKGFDQTLISNGILINSVESIDNLRNCGINTILLSIDSLQEEKHNLNRNNNNAFSKMMKAINFLSESDIKGRGVSVSVSNNNFDEIEGIIKFCIKKKMTMISLLTERNQSILQCIDIKRFIRIIDKYKDEIDILTHDFRLNQYSDSINWKSMKEQKLFEGQNICNKGDFFISIDIYGDVRACNFSHEIVGNYYDEPIFNIWEKIVKDSSSGCKSF